MALRINDAKMRQLQSVAVMKYKLGLTNVEIAKRLNVSAMSISRFLDMALDVGIVRISVQTPIEEDTEMEKAIREKYGLRDIVVVSGGIDSDPLRATVMAAAEYLDMILTDNDVLGIAAGRTIGMTIPHLRLSSVKDPSSFEVVQIMGGNYVAGRSNPSSMISNFVNKFGANGFLMQVPSYAKTEEQYESIKESLWETFLHHWNSCTTLVFALGTVYPSLVDENDGMFGSEDYDEIVSKHAVGRLCGYWIDADGNLIDCSCNRRTFSIPFDIVRNVPIRVSVTSGIEKIDVLKAALKSRLVNVVITDTKTAKAIL